MISKTREIIHAVSRKSLTELLVCVYSMVYRKLYFMFNPFRPATSISDDQAYPQVCLTASNSYRHFNRFRRNPIYTLILEHVTKIHGQAYLEVVSEDCEIFSAIEEFRKNDRYGGPRTFNYPGVGKISPTTLRYVKVLCDLKRLFQTLDGMRICEIGVGYGGQCRVLNVYFQPTSYCLIDIQPALALTRRYLDNFLLPSALTYLTVNELTCQEYDLVISNYAFSELRRDIQEAYLHKVVLNSRRGYITFNDIAPSEFGSISSNELLALIPGAKIINEVPLTHPNNKIIVWGDNCI